MRRLAGLRNHGLSIVFGLLFLGAITGQALSGLGVYNERVLDAGCPQRTSGPI